jgi:predicted HD superfamily hydrolase involved in NAD metabolism
LLEADLDKITRSLESELAGHRFFHSLGVAYLSASLAAAWGVDPDQAFLAGILHDNAKGIPRDELLRLSRSGRYPVEEIDFEYPELLHASAGAVRARDLHGIEDMDVLDAIAHHPTGRRGATALLKVLMAADYCEPNRDFPGVDEAREKVRADLDAGLLDILAGKLRHVQMRGRTIHPRAHDMIRELEKSAGR